LFLGGLDQLHGHGLEQGPQPALLVDRGVRVEGVIAVEEGVGVEVVAGGEALDALVGVDGQQVLGGAIDRVAGLVGARLAGFPGSYRPVDATVLEELGDLVDVRRLRLDLEPWRMPQAVRELDEQPALAG
jgi:hypothetical protein